MASKSAVVIGGGVVGLSIARRLAQSKFEVVLCEQGRRLCAETSSRNSGVIHAGIHYPEGSLMGFHCRRGRDWLYEYLRARDLPHEQCGKLVIATADEDIFKLEGILRAGQRNGVTDLRMVSFPELRHLEPACETAKAGLLSPSTGIVDQHAFMEALEVEAEEAGVMMALDTEIVSVDVHPDRGGGASEGGFVVQSRDKGELKSDIVVNAAGLGAPLLARNIAPYPRALVPRAYFAKGSWYRLPGGKGAGDVGVCGDSSESIGTGSKGTGRIFQRLIYPLPENGGLGVHATLIIGEMGLRFGPDVEWLRPDPARDPGVLGDSYGHTLPPDPGRVYAMPDAPVQRHAFAEAIAQYYPGVRAGLLVPDYSGVRAKLIGPDGLSSSGGGRTVEQLRDFVIEDSSVHGVRGLVQLFGIQSPGLTSCLSIAEDVVEKLSKET